MSFEVKFQEISSANKAEMSFQMERHWTYFRTRMLWAIVTIPTSFD